MKSTWPRPPTMLRRCSSPRRQRRRLASAGSPDRTRSAAWAGSEREWSPYREHHLHLAPGPGCSGSGTSSLQAGRSRWLSGHLDPHTHTQRRGGTETARFGSILQRQSAIEYTNLSSYPSYLAAYQQGVNLAIRSA